MVMKYIRTIMVVLCALTTVSGFAGNDNSAPKPTFSDVAYGPKERQVLDFWKADSAKPTPLLVLIHGGGWIHGDKKLEAKNQRKRIELMLAKGVSVAAINYRYTPGNKLPDPVYDAARAIQFLRYKAKDWNIDKRRIAATGGSAGGCTSLWLATHDDLADRNSPDPVLRESTRLCGALVYGAQTTIDPVQIKEWKNDGALKHAMIRYSCGFKSNEEMENKYDSVKKIYQDFSPVNHLDSSDPPMYLRYNETLKHPTGIHHPLFGYHFKQKADAVNAPVILYIGRERPKGKKIISSKDFLLKILDVKK